MDNKANKGAGAAVYLEDRDYSIDLQISNNLFEGNEAKSGVVLYLPQKLTLE